MRLLKYLGLQYAALVLPTITRQIANCLSEILLAQKYSVSRVAIIAKIFGFTVSLILDFDSIHIST